MKSIDYNIRCVDAINEDEFYEGGEFAYDDIYIVTFDVVGLQQSEGFYYPLLEVKSHRKINIFFVQLYLIILFIVVGTTLYVIINLTKERK